MDSFSQRATLRDTKPFALARHLHKWSGFASFMWTRNHRYVVLLHGMNYATELTSILTGLGDTTDAVAVTLRTAGIKGVRNAVRFLNPLVRYCQSQLRVDDYALDLIQANTLRMVLPSGAKVTVALPAPVRDFLQAFHSGQLPDLELPSP
jgi:hypothetical protein